MGIDQRQSVSFSFNTEDQDKVCSKVLSTLFYKPFFCLFIRCRATPHRFIGSRLVVGHTQQQRCVRACGAKRGGSGGGEHGHGRPQ